MIQEIIKAPVRKVYTILNKYRECIVSGVTPSFAKILALHLANKKNQDAIIIAKDNTIAEELYNFAKELYQNNLNTYYFPSLVTSPYHKTSLNKIILTNRIQVLSSLTNSTGLGRIVICSAASFLQKTLHKSYLQNKTLQLKVQQTIDPHKLIEFLIDNNYNRVSLVLSEGQFAVRGSIIDIFSPLDGAIRLDLFGDTIETIRIFDVFSQKTIKLVNTVSIHVASEFILNSTTIKNFIYNYKVNFQENSELFHQLENHILPQGIENYLPLFYDECQTITDFLQNPLMVCLPNAYEELRNHISKYSKEYEYASNINNTFKYKNNILPPKDLILQEDEVQKLLQPVVILNSFGSSNLQNSLVLNTKPTNLVFTPYKQQDNFYNATIQFIKEHNNQKIFLLTYSKEFKEKIIEYLQNAKIPFRNNLPISNEKVIFLADNKSLNEGFVSEECIFLLESEITGIQKTFNTKKQINPNKILNYLSHLTVGDIVVHAKHGFGQYRGLKVLTVNKAEHDFLEIDYRDQEKLFLPVENIDLLSRYGANTEGITLDKLSSKMFENRQKKVKEQIRDIAYDLIKIAASRNLQQAPTLDIQDNDYKKFCSGFPFIETQDQTNAIQDIINDFLANRPADRLICGDVGFGKTEVAMRAAFLMVASGFQVAVVAPTTILCNQHYHNFLKRFQDFPFIIKQLSRFTKTAERKTIKTEMSLGKIDIIIGTHALLAKDIHIKNLGLIIIDEEQSFGVQHKEKLKTLKNNIHIISLSATPIPRTTQLAFKGIKDLSLLTTPPVNKLPITTHILPFDNITCKYAIDQEIQRQGQVYFVCPRVQDINELEQYFTITFPNKYVVVHGQMPTDKIEKNMQDFENKKYDILLSTNIIESGLDLKSVNTIIIYKSELFGLAQLYQLRGRVGRSNIQSSAYILYDEKKLSNQASKRFEVLQSLDYLGASFALASYDLDIRGAGNLLGEEQSGHMKAIGFELYQQFLEQEIRNLKNKNSNTEYLNFSPTVQIGLPILIPKKYIPDMETSMELYQRIGQIHTEDEINEMKAEMTDRFGNLPIEVENLFLSIHLKQMCKNAEIMKLIFGNKGILFSFYNGKFSKVEELLNYISSYTNNKITIRPAGEIFVNTVEDIKTQINVAKNILEDIRKLRQ